MVLPIRTLHLFAGAGGGILADLLLGHVTVGAVEIEDYPRRVLLARQADGSLPEFPIWDDVTTFRLDNPATGPFMRWLREEVQGELAVCGGFP
jgi:site-specific DNA-cytosine methylase